MNLSPGVTPRFFLATTNGVKLHCAEAGPADGPLLFLLHGFPEFWYGWRNQIGPLAESGYHVVVPDQRGFNRSGKPKEVSSYDLDLLAADIASLADSLKQDKFSVAAHDFGGSVAWWIAGNYAARLSRMAILSCPHPAVWMESMQTIPEQKRKSWYVRFFQLPILPELTMKMLNFKALSDSFGQCIRPDAFTPADLDRYREAWSQPGAVHAMLNWYRAACRKKFAPSSEYRITAPTLLISGMKDVYAVPRLTDLSEKLCKQCDVVRFENATHWVQHDEPLAITNLLKDFLAS